MTKNVIIEEQGLRDGIQNLSKIVSTDSKIDFIHRLVGAGIKRIQIASFVHPKLVPQMADAEAVCMGVKKEEGVLYSGLVLNEKGVERAIAAGLDHVSCSISASESHSLKNVRMNKEQARDSFTSMVRRAKSNGLKVRAGIQCAFGCRYEGAIDELTVLEMIDAHLQEDVDEIAVADSTGMANPQAISSVMSRVVEKAAGKVVALHLHNTENKGYANLVSGVEAGVQVFDTAFGGLGGCPFIDGATGNIATEDSIHMLHQMNIDTGVNWKKVAEISSEMEEILGHQLPGLMYRLGSNSDIKIC